jgi:hypothetical protein
MTSQVLRGTAIGLNALDVINNIVVVVTVSTSGTTPSLIRLGLYDTNLNLVASTANRNASGDFAVTGPVAVPLSAAFTVINAGTYYVAYLQNGVYSVTNPSFCSGTTQTNAGKAITGSKRFWFEQTAQTDLPNPATSASPLSGPIWFGLN